MRTNQPKKREKIIQISDAGASLTVLTDRGRIFELRNGKWKELPRLKLVGN